MQDKLVELLQSGTARPPQFRGGGCSSEIRLLEIMKNCSNQSKQLSAFRTTSDNVEGVLQVGFESQKWEWQLDYE